MTTYRPVSERHAIDQAVVGIRWRDRPSEDLFKQALELASNVAEKFSLPGKVLLDPLSLMVGRQHITFGYDGTPEVLGGYLFQQVYPDGSMAQELTLERSAVTFRTRDYRRWADVQRIIENAVLPIALLLTSNDSTKISVIEFQCVDKFVDSAGEAPPLSDIIRADTVLMPSFLVEKTSNLHSHVGWFEEVSESERYLYNVNVDVIDGDESGRNARLLQIISRHMRHGFPQSDNPSEQLMTAFDDLHARDKGLLEQLLTDEVQLQINLSGSTV